jgi:hypothetical protein
MGTRDLLRYTYRKVATVDSCLAFQVPEFAYKKKLGRYRMGTRHILLLISKRSRQNPQCQRGPVGAKILL